MRVRLLIRKPKLFTLLAVDARGPSRGARRVPRNPRDVKRSRRVTVVTTAVAALATLYVLIGSGGIVSLLQMHGRAEELRHEIARAERANELLRDQIRALREDPHAVEKVAREELGMARPDETIYILPPAPADEIPSDLEMLPPGSPTGPSLPDRR